MSENQKIANTDTMTADQAKKSLEQAGGGKQAGKNKGGKGGVPPMAIIIVVVIVLIGIGSFMWMQMNKKPEVTQQTPEEAPHTIDNVGQGIQQTQATYNPSQQPMQDNSISENTSFIVDETIVYKDATTGQYMIKYKNMAYPIDSDLGKEAINFYQAQGTNPLILLQRLQEKEQAQANMNQGTEDSENNQANLQLQAENDDLKSLVEVQDRTIKELKASLITIAKAKEKSANTSTTSSRSLHIPKGASRIEAFAVVGDRAWLTDSNNHDYSVSIGDKLPDNRKVYAIDSNIQAVWVK